MVVLDVQAVCSCGARCTATLSSNDDIFAWTVVAHGGCMHWNRFAIEAQAIAGGWFFGPSANIVQSKICIFMHMEGRVRLFL